MRWLVPTLLLALLTPAVSAEIRVEVSPDGRKVFTNTGPAASRRTPSLMHRIAPDELEPLILDNAGRNRLDPALVHAVIRAESGYNPHAVSAKGAIGLMQLMPATARELDVDDPRDPSANIAAGTLYLRHMLDQFEGSLELALAGYNAGPEAVRRFGGVPPFPETRNYVERVLRDYRGDANYTLQATAGVQRVGRPVFLSRDASGRAVLTTLAGN
jgi:soluble lytic murein transglycosylase-like protein